MDQFMKEIIKEEKLHGKGFWTRRDGRSYEGEYVKGLQEGFGVFK